MVFSSFIELDFVGAKPYSLSEIVAVTQNFEKEIGRGGFGRVYYGKLHDGQEVAIKVLDVASRQGSTEFFNEVYFQFKFLSNDINDTKIQHNSMLCQLFCPKD